MPTRSSTRSHRSAKPIVQPPSTARPTRPGRPRRRRTRLRVDPVDGDITRTESGAHAAAGDEDVERLAVDLPGANLSEQARQHERARGLSVSRFAHPRLLIDGSGSRSTRGAGLCNAGCGLAADVWVTDEGG